MLPEHPLAGLITAAAAGRFPPADGGWTRVPPWRPGLEAVIAFTGHAVFAVEPDISSQLLASLGADGFGGAHDPRLITALAGPDGWIDSLDILMAAQGAGEGTAQDAGEGAARGVDRPNVPPALVSRPDLAGHPRAAFAAGLRARPQILGYPDPRRSAVIIVSEGIAGLTELSFELEPDHRGQGGGAELARDALSAIPDGQLALAAVAPGNAASLRALLAAGFAPLGSVQLFRRARHDPGAPD
jgi:GNAT superfamily N-acetyltransferase